MDGDYGAFLKSLGSRVKELRKKKGWSLRDMVIMHGYHDSQWRKYEAGGGLTIQSLLRIARVFEVSLTGLLDGLDKYPTDGIPEIKKKPVAKRAKRRE